MIKHDDQDKWRARFLDNLSRSNTRLTVSEALIVESLGDAKEFDDGQRVRIDRLMERYGRQRKGETLRPPSRPLMETDEAAEDKLAVCRKCGQYPQLGREGGEKWSCWCPCGGVTHDPLEELVVLWNTIHQSQSGRIGS